MAIPPSVPEPAYAGSLGYAARNNQPNKKTARRRSLGDDDTGRLSDDPEFPPALLLPIGHQGAKRDLGVPDGPVRKDSRQTTGRLQSRRPPHATDDDLREVRSMDCNLVLRNRNIARLRQLEL